MYRPTGSMSNMSNRRHESQQLSPEMESVISHHYVQQPSIYAVQSDGLFDLFVAKHTVDFSLKRQLLSRNGFMIPWEKFSHLSFSVVGQKEVRKTVIIIVSDMILESETAALCLLDCYDLELIIVWI